MNRNRVEKAESDMIRDLLEFTGFFSVSKICNVFTLYIKPVNKIAAASPTAKQNTTNAMIVSI